MATSVRLPEDLEKKLSALSTITGKKKSGLIIEALREYFEDLEDYYTVSDRMRNYDPTESVSLDKVKALYEMED